MTEALRSAERIDPTPVSEPMPMSFGRYEVRGIVGEGSMGRIYEGYDPLGNRTVAIKALRPENFTSESRDEYLKRFRREAQAAGALSHPSIVTIYDVGEDYFVMELLHGQTLQSILQETGRLGFDEAMAILDPVAAALDYAHEQGIDPPRHQAGEHHGAARRPREAHRLRHRAPLVHGDDGERHVPRLALLHGARAGADERGLAARRPLFARGRRLRNAHRHQGFFRRGDHLDRLPGGARGSAAANQP